MLEVTETGWEATSPFDLSAIYDSEYNITWYQSPVYEESGNSHEKVAFPPFETVISDMFREHTKAAQRYLRRYSSALH